MTKRLRQLIMQRLGVELRDRDSDKLRIALDLRRRELQLAEAEDYADILQRDDDLSRREWRALGSLLTTGETFFFRDRGQVELLRNTILPELIGSRPADDGLATPWPRTSIQRSSRFPRSIRYS